MNNSGEQLNSAETPDSSILNLFKKFEILGQINTVCAGKFVVITRNGSRQFEFYLEKGQNPYVLVDIGNIFGSVANERQANGKPLTEKQAKQAIASGFSKEAGGLFSKSTCPERSWKENNLTHSGIVAAADLQKGDKVFGGGQFAILEVGEQRVLVCGGMSDEYEDPARWPEQVIKNQLKEKCSVDVVIFCHDSTINTNQYFNRNIKKILQSSLESVGQIIFTKEGKFELKYESFSHYSNQSQGFKEQRMAKNLTSRLKEIAASGGDPNFWLAELNKILADPSIFADFNSGLKNNKADDAVRFLVLRNGSRAIIFWGSKAPIETYESNVEEAFQNLYSGSSAFYFRYCGSL